MWLMLSELSDSRVRTTAVGVCTAANWLTNGGGSQTFPLLAGSGLEFAYARKSLTCQFRPEVFSGARLFHSPQLKYVRRLRIQPCS
jgi:hypothetical protein